MTERGGNVTAHEDQGHIFKPFEKYIIFTSAFKWVFLLQTNKCQVPEEPLRESSWFAVSAGDSQFKGEISSIMSSMQLVGVAS